MSSNNNRNAVKRSVPLQWARQNGEDRPSTETIMTRSSCGEPNKTSGPVLKTSSPSYPRALFFPFPLDEPSTSAASVAFVSSRGNIGLVRCGITARTSRFARMAFAMMRERPHAATRILKNGNTCNLVLLSVGPTTKEQTDTYELCLRSRWLATQDRILDRFGTKKVVYLVGKLQRTNSMLIIGTPTESGDAPSNPPQVSRWSGGWTFSCPLAKSLRSHHSVNIVRGRDTRGYDSLTCSVASQLKSVMHNFESWPIGTCTGRGVGELQEPSDNTHERIGVTTAPQEAT